MEHRRNYLSLGMFYAPNVKGKFLDGLASVFRWSFTAAV